MITRRRFLAAGAGTVFAGSALGLYTQRQPRGMVVLADTPGFHVPDQEVSVESPPDALTFEASGEFSWELESSVDQVRADLYVSHDNVEEHMGHHLVFNPSLSGEESYFLDTNLYHHSAIDESLFDLASGETAVYEITAAVEASVVDGGDYLDTVRAEDTFEIEVRAAGNWLEVSGEGSVTFE